MCIHNACAHSMAYILALAANCKMKMYIFLYVFCICSRSYKYFKICLRHDIAEILLKLALNTNQNI